MLDIWTVICTTIVLCLGYIFWHDIWVFISLFFDRKGEPTLTFAESKKGKTRTIISDVYPGIDNFKDATPSIDKEGIYLVEVLHQNDQSTSEEHRAWYKQQWHWTQEKRRFYNSYTVVGSHARQRVTRVLKYIKPLYPVSKKETERKEGIYRVNIEERGKENLAWINGRWKQFNWSSKEWVDVEYKLKVLYYISKIPTPLLWML